MINKKVLFFIGWFLVCFAGAETRVESSVYPKQVHPQDELTFTLRVYYNSDTLGSGIRSPRLPPLDNFYLIGKRESHSVTINFGKTQREKRYHYTLRPKREGRFTINPVEVVVGGSLHRTLAVEVEVSSRFKLRKKKPSQVPRGFSSPFGVPGMFQQFFGLDQGVDPGLDSTLDKKDILFGLELNKRKIYLGELIVARWIVYQREGLMGTIVSALMEDRPDMDGFWVEPLTQASGKLVDLRKSQKIGGVSYRKYLLDDYALAPLRAGTLKIGSVKAILQLAGGSGGGGVFSFFQSGFRTLHKLSKEISLNVLPLPKKGRDPSLWTGAVGDWTLSAQVNKKVLLVNDSFIYRVVFKGRGQTRLIQLPSLDFGSSLELYDQVESQKFSLTESRKEYELVVIPRQAGEIVIPKFELQTFDPDLGIYKTHSLPSFSLEVKKPISHLNTEKDNEDNGKRYFRPSLTDSKKEVAEKQTILSPDWLEGVGSKWWSTSNRNLFWIFVYSILGICFLGILMQKGLLVRKKEGLEKVLEDFNQRVNQVVADEDWKTAGAILLDLIYWCLSEQEVSGKVRNLDLLLQGLPPHLKKTYESQIRTIVDRLEQISFSPQASAKQFRNKSSVLKIRKKVFRLLRKLSL